MTTTTNRAAVRFHVSLDTSDLNRAIAFYTAFFGQAPAKLRSDWAKFETEDPPLVLSLNATPQRLRAGRLQHLGLRLPSSADVAAARERLVGAGLTVRDELGATCCYARQDKVWVDDPDGTHWEVYALLEDIEAPSAAPAATTTAAAQTTGCCAPTCCNADE